MYTIPVDPTYDNLLMFEETIEAVYREELFRDVDPSGRAAGMQMALAGKTVDDLRTWVRASPEWHEKHDPKPVPPPPSRHDLLTGQLSAQGVVVHTTKYGDMPWWPAAWCWLDSATRAEVAPQLLALGDTIMLIDYPDGSALYDEADQFYAPTPQPRYPRADFGPLLLEPAALAQLMVETLSYGFTGLWLFLGGDDGQRGYPIAVDQVQRLAPFLMTWQGIDLNEYTVWLPGWDGVWHKPGPAGTGYTPQQIRQFGIAARDAGARYVGIEGGTGYLLCGENGGDYGPGGNMEPYDLLLLEFDDDAFVGGDVWQILPRYFGASQYVRPLVQQVHDTAGDPLYPEAHDPAPPWICREPSARGPYVPRIFEYFMYGFVRGTPAAQVAAAKARFATMVPSAAALIC